VPAGLTPRPPPLRLCSIFEGRRVVRLVPTKWGTHSLVAAARSMVEEALSDPRNQRFWLLSGEPCPRQQPAARTRLGAHAGGCWRRRVDPGWGLHVCWSAAALLPPSKPAARAT
jgi:hypothetical protein